jgi:alpha-L-rhamnosidase
MEPQPGDLSWAKGRIPTPYGAIDAQWHVQATGIDLTVTVPTGTHATIGVPVPEGRHAVSVNGRILPTDTPASGLEGMDRRSGYVYLRDLPAGRYRILTDASRSR